MTLFEHGTTVTANLIRIRKSAANQYGFFVSDATPTLCGADVAATLSAGWHMFTLVWSAAGTLGYLDGVQVVADTTGVVVPASLATNFYIGSNQAGALQADQSLDALRIWNRPLTAAEILQAYRSGR
jgi:hypothetical protein